MYELSLFIFRRDFRLHDNISLIKALKESKKVIPIFIYTKEQLLWNKYKSNNAVQFMIESLKDLEKQLKEREGKLYYFYEEDATKAIEKIIKKIKIDAIYFNMDYSPYSVKRDKSIMNLCEKNGIECHIYEDLLLNPVCSIKTGDNKIYTKFTPYFNKAKKKEVDKPIENHHKNYYVGRIKTFRKDGKQFYKENHKLFKRGGREEAQKIMKNIDKFEDYNKTRNCLTKNTTYLSAYIKYGCVSIREVYWKFKDKLGMRNELIKQLYWREFYYNILYKFPYVIGHSMKHNYDKIKWIYNPTWFKKWTRGETGFPIVDAGMRQMNETGFMHNRARLIVSNFLIKILAIDWRKGEKYFAKQLLDYDVANNNGNWQWGAGTGASSQEYYKIFNPWLQSIKFDPKGEYIKRWIPELRDVDAKDLHQWGVRYVEKYGVKYPEPMVGYKKQKENVLKMYKKALRY